MNSDLVQTCVELMSDEFLQLKTIEEKINKFMSETKLFEKFCNDFIEGTEDYHQNHKKCLTKGKHYLEEGNCYYNQNNHRLAVDMYSNAIMNIPYPSESGTNELSLAYSSRSNAFYKLKEYTSALFDANCALDLLKTIGMNLRKIHCLVHLDRYSEAKQLLTEIMEKESNSEENNSLLVHIKELKERLSDRSFEEFETKNEMNSDSESMDDIFLNESISTFISSSKGRGYVAKQDIKKGTVVMSEKPFVSILNEEYLRTHCNECIKRVNNQFIACTVCTEVVFCSKQCLNNSVANRHHRNECTIAGLLRRYGNYANLIYKMVGRIGIKRVIDLYDGYDVNEEQTDSFLENYKQFLLFNDHSQQRKEVAETFDVVIAVKLSLFLYYMKAYEMNLIQPKEQFIKLCLIFIRDIRKILINYFGIYERKDSKGGQEKIGDMILISGTLYNHNCSPNIIWIFKNQKLNFIAFKDIKVGKELTVTYGPTHGMSPLHERQRTLKSKYYFNCKCNSCLEDSKYVLALQCLHCKSGPVLCEDVFQDMNYCLICGQSYENLIETIVELRKSIESLENLLSELEKHDNYSKESSIQTSIDSIDSLSKVIYSKSLFLIPYIKRLSRLCFSYKKFKLAMDYSQQVLSTLNDKTEFESCLEMSFFSRSYYELLRHKRSTDKNDWLLCIDLNEKIYNLLKRFRSGIANQIDNSSETPNQTLSSLNSVISLKESIINRMRTQFLKLGLI